MPKSRWLAALCSRLAEVKHVSLPDIGFIYITGKIGSFLSFFLSRTTNRKVILFYEDEDEALSLKKRSSFFIR